MTGKLRPDCLPSLSRADEKLLGKLELKKHREETGLFAVEGVRLLEEAFACGLHVEWAATSLDTKDSEIQSGKRVMSLLEDLIRRGRPVYRTSRRVVRRETDLVAPQHVLALCRIPSRRIEDWKVPKSALVVVCDRLSNPGNLGSLVRVAVAAGADAALLTGGTVDPWNPKSVRGSMGALFRLPVFTALTDGELTGFLDGNGFETFVAAADGEDIFRIEAFPARGAVVFGSEARGAGACTVTAKTRRLSVPMAAGVESLNVAVAAGIVLYRVRERLRAGG